MASDADPRITCELLARDDLSLKSTLPQSWGRQWQDVLNDTGNGKLNLQNDDADLALVEYGDFIRFSLDGEAVFVIVVETMDRTDIAAGEEVDEITAISGRGALAVLEDAVIYPDNFISESAVPFADARVFNFASFNTIGTDVGGGYVPSYDWGDRLTEPMIYQNHPTDFPGVFSHWIGPQAPDGAGSNPPGDWYFFAYILDLPEALYRLFVGYDDAIDLWVDNVPILANEGYTLDVTKTVDLFLSGEGFHYICAKITNRDNPDPNPTAITMALCTLNPDQSVDAEYWATDPSDGAQYVIAYPPIPPGLSVGELYAAVKFDSAELIGVVPSAAHIVQGWTRINDSNGVPWVERPTPSAQIGTDFLTFLKQLAESYFDFRLDPATFTLNLYQTFGVDSGVDYIAAENITDLKHAGRF